MMHGFASDTGKEMWAYVPSFAYPKLKQLADANYATNHEYITDGAPTVADVWDGSNWRTILVAGLNAGGRGYYALDVTDATSPVLLWEFTDDNLGLTFGNPLVGKLTDGTWTVFVTSGYNNAPPTAPKGDGQGRLYALDALRGRVKFTIPTGTGDTTTPSNLGRISGWTDNGLQDNTIQRIYGGDMLGNLWRFDINNQYPDLASPAPKQSGRDAALIANFQISGTPQPITAKPELGLLPYKDASGTVKNVPLVFVGTGRYLGVTDVSDTSQQSLYGIWDKLTATAGLGDARTASACKLVQQSIVILDANTRVAGTPNPVDFSLTNVCGWYIDLSPGKASPGERINVDMRLQLGVLGVITNVPENSVCTIGGSSWIYFFNPLNGGKVGSFVEITDINGQPSVVAANKVGEKIGNSTAVGLNTYRMPDGRVITTVTTSDDKHASYGNPNSGGLAAAAKRVLWRELLQ
jgi:type IV pilus assembly protein PilY1